MNQDAVFYGVVLSVFGAVAVVAYLFYWTYKNATKGDDKG